MGTGIITAVTPIMAGEITGTGILTISDFTSSWTQYTIATAVNAYVCTHPWIYRNQLLSLHTKS
jgi:hypothetical protein